MHNYIDLWGFHIYYYGIIMASALVIGYFLAYKQWQKKGLKINIYNDLIFYIIIFGFIGARLWYVLFAPNLAEYLAHPLSILNLRNGGLAIHGGICGGLLTIIYFSKKYHIPLLKMTDIGVISLILGQAIGRWGNFFNQEAHGPITSLEVLQQWHLPSFIIQGMHIGNYYYVPTFLIESILNVIGFVILLLVRKAIKNEKINGIITALYLIWYGTIRFGIEILRTDALLIGNLKIAQITSLVMIGLGVIILINVFFKKQKGLYENSN